MSADPAEDPDFWAVEQPSNRVATIFAALLVVALGIGVFLLCWLVMYLLGGL